ncbi:hypothetical protein WJU23_16580 [Prosthecobacter sp. SYSU 5D2]|uniref:hypothetical protein n=1 Tax=Prosthecobacter sp. SYSU 5D2 TaxID=3134134 RepID=UPI0031FE4BA3
MKTKSLLAALLFASTAAASADETVEINMLFTLKVHEQNATVTKGNIETDSFRVFSVKTFDIIQMIGLKEGRLFSKKARLLAQLTFDNNGQTGSSFLIRDPGQSDLVVSSYFPSNTPYAVTKSKLNLDKKTGTGNVVGQATIDVQLNGEDEGFYLIGPLKANVRDVQAPAAADVIVQLTNLTINASGGSKIGAAPNTKNGYASGSVKFSGAKIIK